MAQRPPLSQNLATLQRTHEVYRRARELAGAGTEVPSSPANGNDDGSSGAQQPRANSGMRDHMERELAASVRQLRAVQAGQQVAAQHAADEQRRLQAALRDERERSAQAAAHSQEELRQERIRNAKLVDERQAAELLLATMEAKLETQATSAKKELSMLQAQLVEAAAKAEAAEQERDELRTAMGDAGALAAGGARGAARPAQAEQLEQARAALEAERRRAAALEETLAAAGGGAPAAPAPPSVPPTAPPAPTAEAPPPAAAAAAEPAEPAAAAAAEPAAAAADADAEPAPPPKKKEKKPAPLTPAAPPARRVQVAYPVLGSGTAAREGAPPLLVLGGGGGASKTGVPNRLLLCALPAEGVEVLGEQDTGSEAVTSLAVGAAAAAPRLACVQGDAVVVYDVDAAPAPPAEGGAPPALFLRPERLRVAPDGAAPPPAGGELPKEQRPYCVGLGARGSRLAVGMEDGALLLFAASDDAAADGGAGGGGWRLCWRERAHAKEVRDCCFSPDGATLATVAPDGQCLLWPLEATGALARPPAALAQPAFTWFKLLGSAKDQKKKAQWRCVRIGAAAGGTLFAAISHTGGPGWLVRASVQGAKLEQYARAGAAPVTALDVSADGLHVAAANSEGELLVFAASSLQRLVRVQPHDIFVTSLRFSGANAVLTCAGDNSNVLTPLSAEMLSPRGPWLSMLVALVAVAIALLQMMG